MKKAKYDAKKYHENRAEIRKKQDAYIMAYPERRLLYQARARATKAGIPFSIEEKDIFIPEACPILGIPLYRGVKNRTDNSPSLDKILPNLGYKKGNVQVISWRANRMKNDASPADLLSFAKWVIKNAKTLSNRTAQSHRK